MVKTFADLKFLVSVLKSTSKLFKLRSQTRGVAGNICFYKSFILVKSGNHAVIM